MKRWILLIFLVVALSGAGTVLVQYIPMQGAPTETLQFTEQAKNEKKGPSGKAVLFEPTTFNFGTMPQRETGKHTWKIKNEGPGDLDIWMKSSTCSCTLAKFKDGKGAVVKPGETSDIDLEFETRENNGGYEKGADIGTSDPAMPSFALRVQGQVFPAVMTFPPDPMINFSNISNDTEENKSYVAVFSKDRPETKVVKISSSKPDFIVGSVEPLDENDMKQLKIGQGSKVVIAVKSGLPLGLFSEEVIIETDHPSQPQLKLTVGGRMTGPIVTIPGRIVLHDANTASGGSAEIKVSVRGNRETKFEVAKAPKGCQVEVLPADNAGKPGLYKLVLTVPPGAPVQQLDEDIVLKTDHPHAAEVIVPTSIWVLNSN